ncbi:MAG: biotin/lipoyl-binding protein [Hyphomicrobiaceae bacterium]|nr:biotin/lipoyl-binding protein [Hyphomicrobiaceae bacterium]
MKDTPNPRDDRDDTLLPELRAELQVVRTGRRDASGGGIIHDPLRGRYFKIDEVAAQLLAIWPHCRTGNALAARAEARYGLGVSRVEIDQLVTFLRTNTLTAPANEREWRTLVDAERQQTQGWLSFLVHNYLFIRIPLFKPQTFLERLTPIVAMLSSSVAAAIVFMFGLTGLYLVSRQWDVFLATFPHMFSLGGIAAYVLALVLVKSLHELGHGATAVRYGCRVPTMGVCFMVLVPMLFTDVTDAWRLTSRRQRLVVHGAGIVVETAIACLATFAWAFLPDGPARSIAFALATTGWLFSLGINLNPFMRFDGYYLLSDFSGIENLQPRAFSLGRWHLRRVLFGVDNGKPDQFGEATERWLVAYAWMTWLYRVVLFTGIALLVYHMTFKVLGVVLFAIEIIYFIALPIWRELREWYRMRGSILKSPRAYVTILLLALAIGALFVPWAARVTIPAIAEDRELEQIFAERDVRVVQIEVSLGQQVKAGEVLVRLESPELDQERRLTELKIRMVTWRLARRAGDMVDRNDTLVLLDTLASLKSKQSGIEAERAELLVAARRDGIVVALGEDMHVGRWLPRGEPIAVIRSGNGDVFKGYISEDEVVRLVTVGAARFVPEDLFAPSIDATIEHVAAIGGGPLAIDELGSHYGGAVPVRPHGEGAGRRVLAPVTGQFVVTGSLDRTVAATGRQSKRMRGVLVAAGRRESIAARVWRHVLKVLVRESGV